MARHFAQWLAAAVVGCRVVIVQSAPAKVKKCADQVVELAAASNAYNKDNSEAKAVHCPSGVAGDLCTFKCKANFMPKEGASLECSGKTGLYEIKNGPAVCVDTRGTKCTAGSTVIDGITWVLTATGQVTTNSGTCAANNQHVAGTKAVINTYGGIQCRQKTDGTWAWDYAFYHGKNKDIKSATTWGCKALCNNNKPTGNALAVPTSGCTADKGIADCLAQTAAMNAPLTCATPATNVWAKDFNINCDGSATASVPVLGNPLCEAFCEVGTTALAKYIDFGAVLFLHGKGASHDAAVEFCRPGWKINTGKPKCANKVWTFDEVKCDFIACTDASRNSEPKCKEGGGCSWTGTPKACIAIEKCSDHVSIEACRRDKGCKPTADETKCMEKRCEDHKKADDGHEANCAANVTCKWDKTDAANPVCRERKCTEFTDAELAKKPAQDACGSKDPDWNCAYDAETKKCGNKECANRAGQAFCAKDPEKRCGWNGKACAVLSCADLAKAKAACTANATCKAKGEKCEIKGCEDYQTTEQEACVENTDCEFVAASKKCVKKQCDKLALTKCYVNGTTCKNTGDTKCVFNPTCADWKVKKKSECKADHGCAWSDTDKCEALGCDKLTKDSLCKLNATCTWKKTTCKVKACADYVGTACKGPSCKLQEKDGKQTCGDAVTTTTKGPTTTAEEKVSSADRTSPASVAVAAVVAFMAAAAGEAKTRV